MERDTRSLSRGRAQSLMHTSYTHFPYCTHYCHSTHQVPPPSCTRAIPTILTIATYQAPPPSCTRAIPTIHPLYPLYSLLPLHLHQEYATGGAFTFLGFDESENYAFYERRADGRQES